MEDKTEKYWLDLVRKLKNQLVGLGCAPSNDNQTAFHNRIWEAVSEAFRRGQTAQAVNK